jgi:hypothetical protein
VAVVVGWDAASRIGEGGGGVLGGGRVDQRQAKKRGASGQVEEPGASGGVR